MLGKGEPGWPQKDPQVVEAPGTLDGAQAEAVLPAKLPVQNHC